jgi:hypothetical protein
MSWGSLGENRRDEGTLEGKGVEGKQREGLNIEDGVETCE